MSRRHGLVMVAVVFGTLGCGGNEFLDDAPIPVAPALDAPVVETSTSAPSAKRDGPYEKKFDGIRFTIPAGWMEVQNDKLGFIDAVFEVPAGEEKLRLTFSSIGGGIDANVERWLGQVQQSPGERPMVEPLGVDGTEATWVDLRGTYIDDKEVPHPNWRVLGVAIPMQPRDFYVKILGPREAVAEVAEDFRNCVKSARLTK